MSKQKENEFRIETEIMINAAKYIYERAEARSYTSENTTVVSLSDLASILDQLPEPEEKDCAWCKAEGDHFLDGKCPTCHTKDKKADRIKELEEYNARLLEENMKLSNELNLPKDPTERAKVLQIINADYEQPDITAAEIIKEAERWLIQKGYAAALKAQSVQKPQPPESSNVKKQK